MKNASELSIEGIKAFCGMENLGSEAAYINVLSFSKSFLKYYGKDSYMISGLHFQLNNWGATAEFIELLQNMAQNPTTL